MIAQGNKTYIHFFENMTEDKFIDSFLEQYYYYENFVLEDVLEEYSSDPEKKENLKKRLFNEDLIEEISGNDNNNTTVEISMRGKNIENSGGYMHFRHGARNKKEKPIPPFMREYKVGIIQYYLFGPILVIAILEAVFIMIKIIK